MFPTAHGVVSQGGNGAPSSGLWTDFSEYPVGLAPTDWTSQSGQTVTIEEVIGAPPAGRVLRCTRTSNGTRLLTWDAINAAPNNSRDIEVLALLRQLGGEAEYGGLCVRATNTTSPTAYSLRNTLAQHCAGRVLNGLVSVGEVIGEPFGTHSGDVWQWRRLRVNGSVLSAKVWNFGEPEPAGWAVEEVDTNLTSIGGAGLVLRRSNVNVAVECGYFAAAFNGATAPSP